DRNQVKWWRNRAGRADATNTDATLTKRPVMEATLATEIVSRVVPFSHPSKPNQGITRAALYARVSTANAQDPEMQIRELQEYCERRGWHITHCYIDAGFSGSKESRPELDKLMADAHRRSFDAVAVWKFDRFARSVSHLLRALETFKVLGIDFIS